MPDGLDEDGGGGQVNARDELMALERAAEKAKPVLLTGNHAVA